MYSDVHCTLYREYPHTSLSIKTHGSSGRVDGPLLETHSLLTYRQPRVFQVPYKHAMVLLTDD